MNPSIVAKFKVHNVKQAHEGAERWEFWAVSDAPFDKCGISEDNSFARWTPSGEITMTVQNPDLLGKIKIGQKYRVYFEEANE